MAFEEQFLDFAPHTVTVEPLSTTSAYGAPSFGTAETYSARVEPGTRVVVNTRGVEEVATATVFVMSSSASVGPQSRITLPDGRQPKILSVETMDDDEGQHHVEVTIR